MEAPRSILESLLKDQKIAHALGEKYAQQYLAKRTELSLPREMPTARSDGFESTFESFSTRDGDTRSGEIPPDLVENLAFYDRGFEAIVLREGAPSYLVRNNTFQMEPQDIWRPSLEAAMPRLKQALCSVGRVELTGFDMDWVGTAWVVAPGIVVTNRHVARLFSYADGKGGFGFSPSRFLPDQSIRARIDFRAEDGVPEIQEVAVKRIRFVAADDPEPDLAFLELEGGSRLPDPIALATRATVIDTEIAVLGYPAYDDRNDPGDMQRIFGSVYGVKRLAPGRVTAVDPKDGVIYHNATTLGGCSGGVIIDLATGEAIGLHFGGRYLVTNYAVPAARVQEYTQKYLDLNTSRSVSKPATVSPAPVTQSRDTTPEASHKPKLPKRKLVSPSLAELKVRPGYQPDFLGSVASLVVPLPKFDPEKAVALPGMPAGHPERHILKYLHHSLVLSSDPERRIALFVAVNIDGTKRRPFSRPNDKWFMDPRLPASAQVGEPLYANNDLDRGHLVRREDPMWGDSNEESLLGELDSFFFTNCSPQHKDLNQKIWLQLEEYILSNADKLDFRATVFSGPIFEPSNPLYTLANGDKVRLPWRYWKVALMGVDRDDGKGITLSATGYILSQAEMLRKMLEKNSDVITEAPFTFGVVPDGPPSQERVTTIEKLTGLDFGSLRDFDPLGQGGTQEGVAMPERISLDSVENIVL